MRLSNVGLDKPRHFCATATFGVFIADFITGRSSIEVASGPIPAGALSF
jgi:hypothetical protein